MTFTFADWHPALSAACSTRRASVNVRIPCILNSRELFRDTVEGGAGFDSLTSAPNPTHSTASISRATSTSPQTLALWSAKEASARDTPGTLRNAFATVLPQDCWHIMPSMVKTWVGGVAEGVISSIFGCA